MMQSSRSRVLIFRKCYCNLKKAVKQESRVQNMFGLSALFKRLWTYTFLQLKQEGGLLRNSRVIGDKKDSLRRCGKSLSRAQLKGSDFRVALFQPGYHISATAGFKVSYIRAFVRETNLSNSPKFRKTGCRSNPRASLHDFPFVHKCTYVAKKQSAREETRL